MVVKYLKHFLSYLNKENLVKDGSIDIVKFHSLFYTLGSLFSVMDFENISWWMLISLPSILASAVLGTILFSISISHYISEKNLHLITETGSYVLIMIYKLILSIKVMKNKKHYHSLLRSMREDFHYVNTKGIKYREEFFENQLITFKGCVIIALFTGAMGGGMIVISIFALLFHLMFGDESSERPLLFPFWFFENDLHASPMYEIFFMATITLTFFETYFYIFVMQSHIVWIRQIATKADIIVWNLQNLLEDMPPNTVLIEDRKLIIKNRLREIIMKHQSMLNLTESYASVFRVTLLYEQIVTSPGVCMTLYIFVEKLDQGEFEIIPLFICIAIIGVVFIPSYMCTHLLEKTHSVGEACWDIPIWLTGPEVAPYLILLIQRSTRQLPTVAAGFEDISLKTYGKMMSRSYSWFTILRGADFNSV